MGVNDIEEMGCGDCGPKATEGKKKQMTVKIPKVKAQCSINNFSNDETIFIAFLHPQNFQKTADRGGGWKFQGQVQ